MLGASEISSMSVTEPASPVLALFWNALASCSKASCGWIMTKRPFPGRARTHLGRNGHPSQMAASKRNALKGTPGAP